MYDVLGYDLHNHATTADPALLPLPLAVRAKYGYFAFNGNLPAGIDLSHCVALGIYDFKLNTSRLQNFLSTMNLTKDSYIAVSATGPNHFRSEVTSNCNKYCNAGTTQQKHGCWDQTAFVRVFNSHPMMYCVEAGYDITARALGEQNTFMLNINPCGFGGNGADNRGGGVFFLPCYAPALSQQGHCDPTTSGPQIPKVIDGAVDLGTLTTRWPEVVRKAQLLLRQSEIEAYCRRPFGGLAAPAAWHDRCADVPFPGPFP